MKNLLFALVFIVLGNVATADELARERLIVRLEASETLSADFEQRTYKESQNKVDVSQGLMKISKPLRFAWFVTSPFEQQVISDGETLWIYDPDLEQATFQPVEDTVQQSPAMILTQPRAVLTDQYDVIEAGNEELISYRLYPVDDESVFKELTIIFVENEVAEIRILDSLGQETVIALTNVVINKKIETSIFDFIPPEGTDVLEHM